jgi:hypothetical protein
VVACVGDSPEFLVIVGRMNVVASSDRATSFFCEICHPPYSSANFAIRERHALYVQHVRQLDVLPVTVPLLAVASVLDRWWSVKASNTYKKAAWKLALDAFPTAGCQGAGCMCT